MSFRENSDRVISLDIADGERDARFGSLIWPIANMGKRFASSMPIALEAPARAVMSFGSYKSSIKETVAFFVTSTILALLMTKTLIMGGYSEGDVFYI